MPKTKWTTCGKGLHDLTDPANVFPKANGERQCRPCRAAAQKAAAQKAAKERAEREGRTWRPRATIEGQDCELESCDLPRHRRYCSTHEKRFQTHGDPYEDVPIGPKHGRQKSLAERRAEIQAEK
ncbi:hypothetical protein [Sporichthya polymorpha]|uniref:hypothetical protein n=1 Tax=Sporichthya polymorpha TaxID=35751 RepID=UPI00035FD9E9|nr:hypothetical protein [Sporichthya polymorpha]